MEEGLHQGGAHHFQTPHQGRKENKNEQEPQLPSSYLSSPTVPPMGRISHLTKEPGLKTNLKKFKN